MSDERLFQDIYDTAFAIANKYNVESIYSIPVAIQLIKFFGKENIRCFYNVWNRIQKQYS